MQQTNCSPAGGGGDRGHQDTAGKRTRSSWARVHQGTAEKQTRKPSRAGDGGRIVLGRRCGVSGASSRRRICVSHKRVINSTCKSLQSIEWRMGTGREN